MEIRECLSVYLESGYLFDDMSGRLKWFEIDKILISFTYGVVRYVGTWGGCRTEKTLEWSFSNMPEDGEIVDVLRYGKIKTMRFDKPYMAFNPYSSYARLEGWVLGVKHQEGITHFKRHNK